MPAAKALVPSIGSIIHVKSDLLSSKPFSSPSILWVGNFEAINFLSNSSTSKSIFVTISFLFLIFFRPLIIPFVL